MPEFQLEHASVGRQQRLEKMIKLNSTGGVQTNCHIIVVSAKSQENYLQPWFSKLFIASATVIMTQSGSTGEATNPYLAEKRFADSEIA